MPGGYIDFINSMLSLRGQRLKEKEIEAELQQQQQAQMMKMVGGIGSAITKAGQQYGENQMASRLWQEYRGGGAGATTPEAATYGNVPQEASFAGAKVAAGGGTPFGMVPVSGTTAAAVPTRFTGGIEELKLRMGMEELGDKGLKEELARKNERERLDIAQGHLTLAAGREGRTAATDAERLANAEESLVLRQQAGARADEVARLKEEQKRVDDAYKSFNAADPKFQAQAKNAEAYNKGVTASLQAMSGPAGQNQETYLAGLQKIDALYTAAESQGLKVDRPKVATWEDLEAARNKQKAIDEVNAGYWTWSKEAEQKEAARLTQELQGMPGYTQNPLRVDPENYIARPSIERPVPPNPEEIRAQARAQMATPAQGASAAAPKIRNVTPDEATKLIGKPPVKGKRYVDPNTNEVLVITW